MRKMCVQRRILWGAIMGLAQAWVAGQLSAATFEFSNPSSRLVLGDYNGTSGSSQVTSRFRTTAPNSVIGWDQQSIVRGSSTANVVSWAWTTSLGFATHSELTRKPALDGTEIVRGTSNWVNNQYVALGNDAAMGQHLRGTSNWVNNQYVALGNNAALGRELRSSFNLGISNLSWINKQYADLGASTVGQILRGTSNWVNNQYVALGNNAAMARELRTSSNWIKKQYADLGASTVGAMLRGTSNWVNNQYVALNNDAGLAALVRTSSNTLMYEHRRLGSVEGDLVGIHQDLKSVDIGSGNVAITGSSFTAHYDLSANTDNVIEFHDSTSFNGNGNRISFARGKTDTMNVTTGSFVTLRDTVLEDFDDTAVKLGARAQLTFGNGTVIELGHDTKLNRDWVCTGNVVIKGYGSKIDLNGHKISIGRDTRGQQGSLVLEDIVLDGVKTGSIVPDGANATVTLRDAYMNLADTMDFSKGTLRAERNVTLSGQNIFSFTSTGKLAVAANSALELDANTSFVYAPSNESRTSLVLEDATSQLVLNGCFFYAPAPGVQLTTGILVVKSNNNLYNTGAQSLSEAITFGDGTLAGDLLIDLQPGASLNIIEGKVDYQNGKN